jgi:hypothetical protein
MKSLETRTDELFADAMEHFCRTEADNIRSDVNERNLCGRLAIILSSKLEAHGLGSYIVDPEYNRQQNGEIKTILDGEHKEIRINCDVIVHTRGASVSNDNLLAIAMKKSNRPDEFKASDRNRLRALTKRSFDDVWSNDGQKHPKYVCGYQLGVYIEIDGVRRTCLLEYYQHGGPVRAETRSF